MNIYIVPISDKEEIWIEKVHATSFKDAELRFCSELMERYDLDTDDPDVIYDLLADKGIFIGDYYDIEEFTG